MPITPEEARAELDRRKAERELGTITPEEARAELARRKSGRAEIDITPEEARQELRRRALQRGEEPEPEPELEQSWLSGAFDSLTHGLAVGFGDRLTAAEAATLGRPVGGGLLDVGDWEGTWDERYDAALEAEKAQRDAFAEENPLTSAGAEITGGIAGALATGGAGLGIKGAMTSAAVGGGLYAAGESEGDMLSEEQMTDAAQGALAGVVTLGVLKGAGKGINNQYTRHILRKAKDQISPDALKKAYKGMYKKVDEAGVALTNASTSQLKRRIIESVKPEDGYNRVSHKKTRAFLKNLDNMMGENPSIQQLEEVRKIAWKDLLDGQNNRFASSINRTIDDYIGRLKPTSIQFNRAPGPMGLADKQTLRYFTEADMPGRMTPAATRKRGEQLIKDLHTARAGYRTWLKTKKIAELLDNVQLSSNTTYAGGNMDSKIRTEFHKLLKEDAKRYGKLFTDKEIEAITKVISGTKIQNMLRSTGQFAGGWRAYAGPILGGLAGGPAGVALGLGIPAAGYAAKKASQAGTSRAAREAQHLAATGKQIVMPKSTSGIGKASRQGAERYIGGLLSDMPE